MPILTALLLPGAHATAEFGDQVAQILPLDEVENGRFGRAVAISGDRAIVGAFIHSGQGVAAGAAWLYDAKTGTEQHKLLADDGAPFNYFGNAVAIDSDRALVGAFWDDDLGAKSGSVYVFDAATGEQLSKLHAEDGRPGDEFGKSVALVDGMVLVGAWKEVTGPINAGAAYLFDLETGEQLFKFLPDDADHFDQFGVSVALHGNLAIIGSPKSRQDGAAYIFDITTGEQLHRFIPSSTDGLVEFGLDVAIEGTIALVGARGDAASGPYTGAAYLFDVQTGEELTKLAANDGAAGDRFGEYVDLNEGIALIGASGVDVAGSNAGAVYLFDASSGQQLTKIIPDDLEAADFFGEAVALSGDTAVVGSPQSDDGGLDAGAAHVLDITTGQSVFKFVPSGGRAFDSAGQSVALSSNQALVGVPGRDWSGAAILFDAETGEQLQTLLAGNATSSEFGNAVALNENTAIVGSRLDDHAGESAGAVYTFAVATGDSLLKINADDAEAGDRFGHALDSTGSIVIIGAVGDDDAGADSGSAYIVDLSTGDQLHKLVADDGFASDRFGHAVRASGARAIVGAWADDDLGLNSGSAYLFDIESGTQIRKLLPDDGADQDWFGISVAIDSTHALVGASQSDHGAENAGAAYLFDLNSGKQLQRFLADDAAAGDGFGSAVALHGNLAVIGAEFANSAKSSRGAIYLFDIPTGQLLKKLDADSASTVGPWFGHAVALSIDRLLVGAPQDDRQGEGAGAALLVDALWTCLADLNRDGDVAGDDLEVALTQWGSCNGCTGDINRDGEVGFADIVALLAAWGPCS